MPLPTAAELTDPNATNADMKELLGQLAENALGIDAANSNPLFKPKEIPVTDLNDLTQEGFYQANAALAATLLNNPSQTAGSIFILVRRISDGILIQEVTNVANQKYSRSKTSVTSWNNWEGSGSGFVTINSDLNNYTLAGSYLTTGFTGITNKPVGVEAAFVLRVESKSVSDHTVIYQTLTSHQNITYVRRSANSGTTWSAWENLSIVASPLDSAADLNTLTQNGYYNNSQTNIINAPKQAISAFKLEVFTSMVGANKVIYQNLTNHQDLVFSRRSVNSGSTWSEWKLQTLDTLLLTDADELDLNKRHQNGVYFGTTNIVANVLNKPAEVTAAFKLEVSSNQVTSSAKVIYQKITNHLNKTWIRRTPNFSVSAMTATWSEWIEEITTANIANIVAPLIPEIPSDIGVFGSYVKTIGTKLAAYQLPSIADINHFLSYGQSLSIGAGGQPAISLTQYASNLTFDGGPRAASGSYLPLKPLTEDDRTAPDGGANRGETLCAGAANYASFLMLKENGIKPANHVILSTAGGRGGYRISQLNKGTTWYENNMLAHINNAVSHCATNSLTYSMPLVSWAQGEYDQNKTDITREQYADLLEQLQIDMQADIKTRSGMQTRIPFVTYQTSWYSRLKNHVALAQLDVVKRNEDFYFSTPMYHLPHASDNLHLNNVGNKLFGCYVGRVYKQLVVDQIHPEFLCPLSAEMQGTKIIVRFHVPKAPLVLDAVNLAATTDHGFKVVDNAGSTVVHSSISVSSDGTKIEIELGSVPVNPIKVRYALDYLGVSLNIDNAASGNLRDSTDDQVSFDGNTYNLWHVCPHFELDVLNLQV